MICYLVIDRIHSMDDDYRVLEDLSEAIKHATECLQKGPVMGAPDIREHDGTRHGLWFVGTRAHPIQVVVVRELDVSMATLTRPGFIEPIKPAEPTMKFDQAMVLFNAMLGEQEVGVDSEGAVVAHWTSPEVNSALRFACPDVPFHDQWRRARNDDPKAQETITGFLTHMRGWLNALELGMKEV